ncbi:hypothetical protein A4X13_0g718 [Tilletia indica]|uniref:Xylose isomerase-like TIM barrel domain-containing protein n=1 Tax=Tilletia indica TaxID=43049 RepID=A0A177TIK6_9BASI|nr:hypothetical protein A4X13_0g718 [Tilletia indica]
MTPVMPKVRLDQPPFCIFSLSAGSSTIGQHSLIRKLEVIAQRGFHSVELMQDDLTAFAESDEFESIYRQASLGTASPSPRGKDEKTTAKTERLTFNAFGPCTPSDLHREVAAAAYIGQLSQSLGIQIASLQPLRDFEGWADADSRLEAFRRTTSRFEVMHALGTNLLFICSNCQPVGNLVPVEEYRQRAGADLAELADLAQAWRPVDSSARWSKLGLEDPIELMARTFPHQRSMAPLSPPESRRGSAFATDQDYEMSATAATQSSASTLGDLPLPFHSHHGRYQPIKIGYEALSWGTHVDLWRSAWDIVECADRPQIGIVLDSFNTIGREWADPCSPSGISQPEEEADARLHDSIEMMGHLLSAKADKIFFLQIADARRVAVPLDPSPNETEPRPSRMIWSRSNRLFPLEAERGAFLPIVDFVRKVEEIGYRGPWSVEVFSDSIHEKGEGVPVTHVDRGYRSLQRLIAAVRSS